MHHTSQSNSSRLASDILQEVEGKLSAQFYILLMLSPLTIFGTKEVFGFGSISPLVGRANTPLSEVKM